MLRRLNNKRNVNNVKMPAELASLNLDLEDPNTGLRVESETPSPLKGTNIRVTTVTEDDAKKEIAKLMSTKESSIGNNPALKVVVAAVLKWFLAAFGWSKAASPGSFTKIEVNIGNWYLLIIVDAEHSNKFVFKKRKAKEESKKGPAQK